MGFSGFPSFRLFTFDTLSPLSRHTQTFAAHAPKAVLTSRDPALVPGRSNSFLIFFITWGETFGGFGPGLSDIHLFSSHEKFQGVLMAVLGYHSNTYTGHRLVGKPDEDGLPVANCMSNDTISFPLYHSTIYDTLYERNFGLLSIMNSGRALDE
ncbi:uncharacterized protein B0T23DRAFT_310826 [Neurospora hispaniola]|uniref:Uncharacterized protein n=1 Tax=Neurospora hispaniola TaxID=588809 RepID=A0AAJ0IDU8_9PEZI|nr:hypothetical protein B0T23DRAFT_310826 [Neurospora hispaniola]